MCKTAATSAPGTTQPTTAVFLLHHHHHHRGLAPPRSMQLQPESNGQPVRQTEKGTKSADTARLSEELFSLLSAEGSKPDDDVVMEKIKELEVGACGTARSSMGGVRQACPWFPVPFPCLVVYYLRSFLVTVFEEGRRSMVSFVLKHG